MSSSAFSISALFPAAAFQVIKGEPVIGGLHGADTQHFFCGWCMTWMFTRPVPMPELVNVRPTMFEDDKWFAPYVETYVENRLPWAITGAKRSYAQFPPMETYRELLGEYAQWAMRAPGVASGAT